MIQEPERLIHLFENFLDDNEKKVDTPDHESVEAVTKDLDEIDNLLRDLEHYEKEYATLHDLELVSILVMTVFIRSFF